MVSDFDRLIVFFGCVGVGLMSLILGVTVQTGRYKRWWLMKSTPITPVNIVYAAIPGSSLFFLTGLLAILSIDATLRGDLFLYLGTPILIIIVVLATWRPRWLVPKWLRWLEDHHLSILPLLKDEAQKMGKREWEKRVRTQAGLEEWVAEVRRKHGLEQTKPQSSG